MAAKVILDPNFRPMSPLFDNGELERLRSFAEVVWARDEPMPLEAVDPVRGEVEAIVTGCGVDKWRYGPLETFPKLRAILEVGGAFPSPELLDYAYCFAHGIRVLSVAPGFAPAVAEMALGMAIAAGRDIVASDAAMRAGREVWGYAGYVRDFLLFDKPVGFIGFGSIARQLKLLRAPFRCSLQVYDPWLTEAYLQTQGVTPASLETLLETAKIIFVLAVPSRANRALLNRELLSRIQPGAVLVLISRAHLVDFDALTEMAQAGRFKAAIDVFPVEPLPKDHPIRQAPGTILSAHRAGGGAATYHRLGRMIVNDLQAILSGLPPQEMQVAQPEIIQQRG
jgi:phosphoglycerate dehydrogenase-like enzyme